MDDVLIAALLRWLHVLAGIMWIGLLYFFNFVNHKQRKKPTPPAKARRSANT